MRQAGTLLKFGAIDALGTILAGPGALAIGIDAAAAGVATVDSLVWFVAPETFDPRKCVCPWVAVSTVDFST